MRISDWSSDVCSSDLRFFTYITSIAEENAFFANGSSAGFGVLMAYDGVNQRLIIAEAYEGAPAFAAGIDRGTPVVGIGTNRGNVRNVAGICAAQGPQGPTGTAAWMERGCQSREIAGGGVYIQK